MPQPPDAVIEVSLQAACIRAAATLYARSTAPGVDVELRNIDTIARVLYGAATEKPWVRGDAK